MRKYATWIVAAIANLAAFAGVLSPAAHDRVVGMINTQDRRELFARFFEVMVAGVLPILLAVYHAIRGRRAVAELANVSQRRERRAGPSPEDYAVTVGERVIDYLRDREKTGGVPEALRKEMARHAETLRAVAMAFEGAAAPGMDENTRSTARPAPLPYLSQPTPKAVRMRLSANARLSCDAECDVLELEHGADLKTIENGHHLIYREMLVLPPDPQPSPPEPAAA